MAMNAPLHLLPASLIQLIDGLKLAGQVTCKECWIGDLYGHMLHQGIGLIYCAKDVHLITQPFQYECGIATRQPLIEIWEMLTKRRVNLRTVEITQGITREIAKARRPMNIL